jgi:type VI secretion system secreted protein VgrG
MAGGSQIIIDKNGITLITPGKMEAKAGQHLFKSGAKVDIIRTILPDIRVKTEHRNFQAIHSETNEILKEIPYSILNKRTGQKIYGHTDDEGMTKTIKSAETDELEVMWFDQEDNSSG